MSYKLEGKINYQGLPISIETDKGSKRYWSDPHSGEKGTTTMKYPYGYIRGTLGVDGDEVDVFVGPKDTDKVFVITQTKKPDFEEIDEQKVMLGFDSASSAKKAYLDHYNDSRFFHSIKELAMAEFKAKLKSHKGKLIKHLFIDDISASIQSKGDLMDCDHDKNETCKDCKKEDANSLLKALTARMLSIAKRHREEAPLVEPDPDPMVQTQEVRLLGPAVAQALHVSRPHEPPAVPVVHLQTPPSNPVNTPDLMTSCNSCGYVHKSLNECPRCSSLRELNSRVSTPIWRR